MMSKQLQRRGKPFVFVYRFANSPALGNQKHTLENLSELFI